MAPTRRQAIIWTNDGLITDAYMRHSASMSQLIEAEWRIYASVNKVVISSDNGLFIRR